MDDATFRALETRVQAITRPEPALLKYFCIVALASNVAAPFLLAFLYFRYKTLRYSFDDDGISMGYGVLFRREMHLTYARMQDIHLSQNVFERWLDIGEVTVQTAGSGAGGDLRIVGVRELRHLKPSRAWLSYRYFAVIASALPVLLYLLGIAAAVGHKHGTAGMTLAVALGLPWCVWIGVSLVAARIDWELRSYLIGDRSLRVRQGAIVQREVTLSFANIQNVEVTQGPFDQAFGFKSLRVSTAGGGGATSERAGGSHDALLAGLDDAEGIRDLVMTSLKRHRDAGMGDHDDVRSVQGDDTSLLREVLEAARELRRAAER